ncbi:hypothetical protein I3843_07G155900 [Carya illinoinensis]|nr:hypothetical protein I3843_07G155900 [Carya illinoinensis]
MVLIKTFLQNQSMIISVATSLAASAILVRNIANDLVPEAVHEYFQKLSTRLSCQLTVVIDEFEGLTQNQMFEAASVYLARKLSPSTLRIKVHKPQKEKELAVAIDTDQELVDFYKGVKFGWVLASSRIDMLDSNKKSNQNRLSRPELRRFKLRFHKQHRDMALSSYLPYILQQAKAITEETKTVKIHTIDYNGTDYWSSINLNHPATFDTMAMDPDTKKALTEDLDRFTLRKEYYRRVGKAWKRGYLLYGPPGTGKSSLVAAMANYLKFDIYDMDLREVQCNSDLRRLLIGTGSRSILVVEDIDCSAELQNRDLEKGAKSEEDGKITLSGLLNFIDGLWSSCGDEKIIVFTTNHKDRLDPALLRPGRMDVHLNMSYCSFSGFRTLASNYLQIQEHPLFGDIKELLEKTETTPAEVARELMKSDDAEVALQGLIKFLQSKKEETGQIQ